MPSNATHAHGRWLPRGGARLNAHRQTWHLTEHDCRKVIASAEAAWAAGTPFNRFVTISWEPCGIDPRQAVKATGDWIKLARDWITARGYRMPWCWVQETGPVLGAHCHILMHVPPELAPLFSGRPERWARRVISGRAGSYVRGTMRTRQVTMGNASDRSPEAYRAALMGRLHYMLKCAPAGLRVELDLTGWGHVPWGQRCLVFGKRAGVWQPRSKR